MSQAGIVNTGNSGGGSDILTLTGDSGGPVSPDVSGNINVNGATTITVAGNPGAHSLTISTSSPAYTTANWTPTITIGTNTFSYVTQSGNYTVIGGLAIVAYIVVWQTIVGAGLQNVVLNLPLTVLGGVVSYEGHVPRMGGITLDAGYQYLAFAPQPTTTTATIVECGTGQADAVWQQNAASAVGPYSLSGTLIYRTS